MLRQAQHDSVFGGSEERREQPARLAGRFALQTNRTFAAGTRRGGLSASQKRGYTGNGTQGTVGLPLRDGGAPGGPGAMASPVPPGGVARGIGDGRNGTGEG